MFVNDGDTIDTLYSDGIVGMLADACKLLGILGILWSRSRGLFLILCFLLPLLFVLTRHFQKGTLAAQRENRRAIGRVNSQPSIISGPSIPWGRNSIWKNGTIP